MRTSRPVEFAGLTGSAARISRWPRFRFRWTAASGVLGDRGSERREAALDRGADLMPGARAVEVAGAGPLAAPFATVHFVSARLRRC